MANIKLIVSDVDSTLMTDDSIIPSEAFQVINNLLSKQIIFVIASGRQLENLYSLFKPYDDRLLFIAQNGAIISEGHHVIFQDIISPETVSRCVSFGKRKNASILLYKNDCIQIINSKPEVLEKLNDYNVTYEIPKGKIKYENVSKISYFSIDTDLNSLQEELKIKNIHAYVSHKYMIDINNVGTNKGTALKYIQSKYNILSKETCAFGDSENDIDMFKEAFYSYAMNNASDNVKDRALRIAPSNNQLGVVSVLNELFSFE